MQKNNNDDEPTRVAFGYLFLSVAIAVAAASILSQLVHLNGLPDYYYILVGTTSFGVVFGVFFVCTKKCLRHIRCRMKNSMSWPAKAKAANGLCWAAPFAAIPLFPQYTPYLLLLGIGLGNLSTHMLLKKLSSLQNKEQLIVAVSSLGAIPLAIVIDTILFLFSKDIAVMVSRLLICASYAAGGTYALLASSCRS